MKKSFHSKKIFCIHPKKQFFQTKTLSYLSEEKLTIFVKCFTLDVIGQGFECRFDILFYMLRMRILDV